MYVALQDVLLKRACLKLKNRQTLEHEHVFSSLLSIVRTSTSCILSRSYLFNKTKVITNTFLHISFIAITPYQTI